MLHIIGQMRNMFMAGMVSYFDFTPEAVDKNQDGYLTLKDFRKMSEEENHALQRMLMEAGIKRETIEKIFADPKVGLEIQKLIDGKILPERRAIVSETKAAGKAHRNSVDPLAGTQFLADTYAGKTVEGNETNNTGGFTRTLKKGMSGQDVVILQQALTVLGFNTNGIDGNFGPGTEKALKAYQASIGAKADGVMTFGKKTMQSLLGVSSGTMPSETAKESKREVETEVSNFQWLFDYIGAGSTDIIPLELREKITNTLQSKDGGGKAAINALFENEVLPRLRAAHLPADKMRQIEKISGWGTNWKVRRDFLNALSSVLMGNRKTNEAARGQIGVHEYSRNLKVTKKEVFEILSKGEGLSSTFVSQTADAVKRAESKIASLKDGVNTVGYSAVGMPTLTVRSQGNNDQLEAKEAGNMQVLTIDGAVAVWDMGEISLKDKITLIENMGYTVKDLGISGVTKPEQLIKLLEAGKVEIDFDMILARNCGNISYVPHVLKKPSPTPTTPGGGSDGDKDTVGSETDGGDVDTPDDNGDVDTDVGEE